MTELATLWLPILLSSILVFIASSALKTTIDGLIYALLSAGCGRDSVRRLSA